MIHLQTQNHLLKKIVDDYFVQKKVKILFWSYWKTILRTRNQDLAIDFFTELEPINL